MKVGDVVLMKNSGPVQDFYKLAVVKEALQGEDGHVRRVVLQYKNLKENSHERNLFRETERSIHDVVVIVPVDWAPAEIETEVAASIARFAPDSNL
jgi:hypothetical protein